MRLLTNVLTNQDTLAASCYSLGYCNNYMNGDYAPHYPLPVLEGDAFTAREYYDRLAQELWFRDHTGWPS